MLESGARKLGLIKMRNERRHEKSHGLISMISLTKLIAKRWKESSSEARKSFQNLADKDLIRYREAVLTMNEQNTSCIRNDTMSQKYLDSNSSTTRSDTSGTRLSPGNKKKDISCVRNDAMQQNNLDTLATTTITDKLGITWSTGEVESLRETFVLGA